MSSTRRLAAVLALSVAAVTACSPSTPAANPPRSTGASTAAPLPSGTASAAMSASPTPTVPKTTDATTGATEAATPAGTPSTATAGQPATHGVVVYYVHDTTGGPRLYTETHPHAATTGVVRQAVEALLHDRVLDPDYTNLWPSATTVRGISTAGPVATIDLSGAVRKASVGGEFEEFALQALVFTVRAASKGALTGVHLRVDGKDVDSLWGHVDTSGTLSARSAETTLAPVQITSPANGATTSAPVAIGGRATVFEATVSWRIVKGTVVVKKGYSTATVGAPGRGDWSVKVQLPKGTYVVQAFESSADDGTDTSVDTKTFTVR